MDERILARLAAVTEEEHKILSGKGLDRKLYTERKDFIIDFQKMKSQQQLVAVRPHTRFIDFPDHKHNYVEMMYMCQGSTKHILNGEIEIVLKAGDLLLLNQYVTHSIEAAGEDDIAVNILALPGFFDFALQMTNADNELVNFLLSIFHRNKEEAIFIHYALDDVLPVRNLVENLIWSILFEEQVDEQINKVTMAALLMNISRHSDRVVEDNSDPQHAVVAEVLKEVEDHYANPNLSAISKKYHVSLAYVSASVKERTGKTFTDLLIEKRMILARDLLLSTNLPVTEISYMVGYSNTSYFYSLFNKNFGMTPNTFRKERKQDK